MSIRRFVRNILDSTHSEWMKSESSDALIRVHGIPNKETRWRFKVYRIIYTFPSNEDHWHYCNTINSFDDISCQWATTYDINHKP